MTSAGLTRELIALRVAKGGGRIVHDPAAGLLHLKYRSGGVRMKAVRPLSYFPLSLWSWQDTVKAVFLNRVNIVSEYDHAVRSPRFSMRLPSVVSLKAYVKPSRFPAFTRFNVFLRDRFTCQYCGDDEDLTFDHLVPRSRGGKDAWENLVWSAKEVNQKKADRLPHEAGLKLLSVPRAPKEMPASALIRNAHGVAEWKLFLDD